IMMVQATEVAAAGTGPDMPWNTPLQRLLDNLSGPTARTLGMLMFVIGALTWGFSRNEEHVRRFGTIVFGCAVAIGVVNLFNALAFQGGVF
ncbi:MAG: TrbC/VirB2 family protein, partial [Longimicrobiales bacterium]